MTRGKSLCLLGGASVSDDKNVKMFTPFVRSKYVDLFSVDPRFKNVENV